MWRDATILTEQDGEPLYGVWKREELHVREAGQSGPTRFDLRDREIRDRHRDGETVEAIAASMRLAEKTVRLALGLVKVRKR